METIEEILKIVAKKSITAYEIAQMTGLSEPGVRKIITGETKRPNPATIKLIGSALEKKFSRDLNNKNALTSESIAPPPITENVDPNGFIYTKHPDGIPALPLRVQGGFSLHYNDPVFWDELERIYIPGLPFKGDNFLWAQMEGDSMEYCDEDGRTTGIQDGAWCLFEKIPKQFWRTGLKKFYVHLIITDTMFTVKRILQDNEEEIILSPDNDQYDQERIHLNTVQAIYLFKRKLDWNAPPPRKHEIKV